MSARKDKSFSERPVIVIVGFIASLIAIVIFVTGIQSLPEMFESDPSTSNSEEPFSVEEQQYLSRTQDAVEHAVALSRQVEDTLGNPVNFQNPDLTNNTIILMNKLQEVRIAEPSSRLGTYHSNVIIFLENVYDASLLLSRYSYSREQSTFDKANDLIIEGSKALTRAAAEVTRIKQKQSSQ